MVEGRIVDLWAVSTFGGVPSSSKVWPELLETWADADYSYPGKNYAYLEESGVGS